MKKLSALLASVLAVSLILTGCGGASNSDSSTGDAKTKLVVATEAGFAPYEYYEGEKIVGVDMDIVQTIADDLGLELEVVNMEFAAVLASVGSGKADLAIAGISINDERKEQMDFSIEYATSKQILVVNENSTAASLADFQGKTIGVQLGTVADLELSETEGVTVKQYNKYIDAAMDLKNGRLDAIGMDILPAKEIVAANPGLKILEQEFLVDSYAIGVKKGNTELLEKVNASLQKMIDSGKIDQFTLAHTND